MAYREAKHVSIVSTSKLNVSPAATAAPLPSLRKPAYMPYGDAARVLGTVAVVIGHVCDMMVYNASTGAGDWWVCLFFDSAARWAVPVYIMLSGALLLDPARTETPGEFYAKRLARLGIPVLVWSAFFMWFSVSYTHWNNSTQVWYDLLLGKPYAHLHFIFRILGLYAFTPMLRVFLAHAPRRMVMQTVLLLLALAAANSVAEIFLKTELSVFLRFVPFLGYFLLGYLLRDIRLTKRALIGCALLCGACVCALTGGTALLVQSFGFDDSRSWLLYEFLSPVRVAFAVAAWLIVTNCFREDWLQSRPGRFVAKVLAPATLGIYLVHPLFREILYIETKDFTLFWTNSFVGIPLATLAVYIPSVLFTLVVMQIPYVRRIAG
jgi:surface polysaccharide O-acyltransferase-like enzyme